MLLNLSKKQFIISKFKKILKKSISLILVNFCNVNSVIMTKLRKLINNDNNNICFIRNTLLKRILCPYFSDLILSKINNSVFLIFSNQDPLLILNILNSFIKDNISFKIKFVIFKNKIFIKKKEISWLSNLPSFKDIIIKIIFLFKEISIGRFFNILLIIKEKIV